MLGRFLFTLTTLLLPLLGEARIIETAHIADAIQLIDEDTWFLVNLDNTMFEAKQALGHANWFNDEIQKRLQNGMSREEAIRDSYPSWIKIQQVCLVKPLEEDFVPSLISLQNRGVVVMGLTQRQPSVAHSTVCQVASLGFDFLKTAPSKNSFSVPATSPTLYLQGILFASDYNKKEDIFLSFLSIIKQSPKKVVFIDDQRKNVEQLEQVLSQDGIECVGVYYTAIEHAQPVYSREVAEFQYKFLDKIMSNEAANLLIKHGLE